jgi:hypothetical protein
LWNEVAADGECTAGNRQVVQYVETKRGRPTDGIADPRMKGEETNVWEFV